MYREVRRIYSSTDSKMTIEKMSFRRKMNSKVILNLFQDHIKYEKLKRVQLDKKQYIYFMKFLILFLLSVMNFAQKLDTINLNQVEVMNYSNYKQFRPKFKQVVRLTDNTSFGLKIFSNLLLPNEKEIEIVAIEI
ncbi:MAG TPA: hypothetical protein DEG63_02900, partial [Flavobacteriaceae bacterium]|nr:hypothetical protein [Flavobacteriaceae bacterium]